MENENLGPAERIIKTILTFSDHLVHNRLGMVTPDPSSVIGVEWHPITYKVEADGRKMVSKLIRTGKGKKIKRSRQLIGQLWADGTIRSPDRRKVAEFREAGIFPEVAVWMYKQAVEVWQLDNEFAAKWASFAFQQDNRGLKVILAALMLVQSRKGDPVRENGEMLFRDANHRDIGEAMMLTYDTRAKKGVKKAKDDKANKSEGEIKPKMLLQIHDVLTLDGVAEINRELGFGRSVRKPFLGRWPKVVRKWLWYREMNPKLLKGLVKGAQKTTVMKLAKCSRYKPQSPKFFEALGWNQAQAKGGHRGVAIGETFAKAESWEGLSEEAICERIVKDKPGWKLIIGMVPNKPGITRAVVAAAIEAGSMSDKDLVNHTPMLEDLGLMKVQDIRQRWEAAVAEAKDMRAANIAANVKSKETREKLLEAADKVVEEAVKEDLRNIRVYFLIDRSSSMQGAIEAAKSHISTFLQGFPLERTHVAVFNTVGQEVIIPHRSAAGVRNALKGIEASGGTDYGAGVRALQRYQPEPDEDVLFIIIGDEEAHDFSGAIRLSGLRPMAFGFIKVVGDFAYGQGRYHAVTDTANSLGIPCFMIDEKTFRVEGDMLKDPYAIPRIVKGLVAATPVGQRAEQAPVRFALAEQILQTDLLQKPIWAEQVQV